MRLELPLTDAPHSVDTVSLFCHGIGLVCYRHTAHFQAVTILHTFTKSQSVYFVFVVFTLVRIVLNTTLGILSLKFFLRHVVSGFCRVSLIGSSLGAIFGSLPSGWARWHGDVNHR